MITIDRAKLAEAAALCAKVAARNEHSLKLHTGREALILEAGNETQLIVLDVPCSGTLEPHSVDALKFGAAVSGLTGEIVGIQKDDARLLLCAGKGRRQLGVYSDNLPDRPFTATVVTTIDAALLKEAIAFCLPHAAPENDPVKWFAAGVHIRGHGGKVVVYGTDGKSLGIAEIGETEAEFGVTIGPRSADLLSRATGQISCGFSDRAAEFGWEGGLLLTSLIENKYPVDHIEKNAYAADFWDKSVALEAPAFLNAVRATRQFGEHDTSARSERLLLTMNGCARLTGESRADTATEEFPANYQGEEFSIGIIASQAERTLKGFGDTVLETSFLGPTDPIKLVPAGRTDRLALLYPVRM